MLSSIQTYPKKIHNFSSTNVKLTIFKHRRAIMPEMYCYHMDRSIHKCLLKVIQVLVLDICRPNSHTCTLHTYRRMNVSIFMHLNFQRLNNLNNHQRCFGFVFNVTSCYARWIYRKDPVLFCSVMISWKWWRSIERKTNEWKSRWIEWISFGLCILLLKLRFHVECLFEFSSFFFILCRNDKAALNKQRSHYFRPLQTMLIDYNINGIK